MHNKLKLQNPIRRNYYAAALVIIATAIILPLAAYGLLTACLMVYLHSTHSKVNAKNKAHSRQVMCLVVGALVGLIGYVAWADFGPAGAAVVILITLAGWLAANE